MQDRKLDVIITAYNCKNTLGRTLDSLVKQTNKNFTALVVDDCSTQDIRSIVEEYKDRLSIRYVRNSENRGCGMSRQRGIDETKADYIAFLDSDDVLLPNTVDVWLAEIEREKPDVIYSPFLFEKDGKIRVKHCFFMCHGKVYCVGFLRKYDIGEAEEIKCCDDSYLNWQAFDLANDVSLLKIPTYIQIKTNGSLTDSLQFYADSINDGTIAKQLAIEKIARYKHNPLSNYEAIRQKVDKLIYDEAKNHQNIIKELFTVGEIAISTDATEQGATE